MYASFIWLLLLQFSHLTYCQNAGDLPNSDINSPDGELILANLVSLLREKKWCIAFTIKLFILEWKLCRHSDRNIRFSYPNDPWQSEEYWPGGYEQLTNVMWNCFLLKIRDSIDICSLNFIRLEYSSIMNWVSTYGSDIQRSFRVEIIHRMTYTLWQR